MTPESESVPLAAAEPESADAAPVDARKAAIEAAVARAKAKKHNNRRRRTPTRMKRTRAVKPPWPPPLRAPKRVKHSSKQA